MTFRRLAALVVFGFAVVCAARAQTEPSKVGDVTGDAYAAALKLLEAGEAAPAIRALNALAAGNDLRAEGALANIYLEGLGVSRAPARAMQWYCRLAYHREGGETIMRGIWRMAEYLRTGGGVPGHGYSQADLEREDPIRALFWFEVLAQQERWYDAADASSQRIGRLGARELKSQLFPAELEKVRVALDSFDVANPPSPSETCLTHPPGLDPAQ